MLKLLIVDDEYNIREGLAHAVDWASAGMEVAGAAGSGAEALEVFDRCAPDIVITDIFMEGMNGLELIEALSAKNHNTKYVLISGYDEFAYARKAIDLKVFRYLLKPILPEEILAVAKELAGEIREERELKRRMALFEREIGENRGVLVRQLLHDALFGRAGDAEAFRLRAGGLALERADEPHVCAAFEADTGEGPGAPPGTLPLGLQRIAEEVFRRFPSCHAYAGDDGRVYVAAGGVPGREIAESFRLCVERVQKAARENLGVTVSAGVGFPCEGLHAIGRSRREALRALEYRMASGTESVIHIRDVLALDGSRFAYPQEEERDVLDALSREDGAALASAVDAFFRALAAGRLEDKRIKAAVAKLHGAVETRLAGLNAPAPAGDALEEMERSGSLEGARQWFAGFSAAALARLTRSREEGVRSVIHSAEKFIQANYKDMELSLTMVADHMGLTPSYFSRLFKQETGSSYIDYVINLRIDAAKRLLRATTHRIFDIGGMVGYPNSQYFCTLFRRACGVSPAEYREGREPPCQA